MRPIGDRSQLFIVWLLAAWVALVVLPIVLSMALGHAAQGLPLLGIVVWFALLRLARWLSPPARADRLMRQGCYEEAIAWCDRALALRGPTAWAGTRRLIWLNRRVLALLALADGERALATALEALDISADPQTVSNCAAALLLLDQRDEAASAARLALSLSRERSVSANATLADVMLARGMPAEAEALARAGLADLRLLLPMARAEHHVHCLAALCRAQRMQGAMTEAASTLGTLRTATRHLPALEPVTQLEAAEQMAAVPAARGKAAALVWQAARVSPRYVRWYGAQPQTLTALRDEPVCAAALAAASRVLPTEARAAIAVQAVGALRLARHQAQARPAAQASHGALMAQLATLAGTAVLLLWWALRFFVST